jgi:hypothetical protein
MPVPRHRAHMPFLGELMPSYAGPTATKPDNPDGARFPPRGHHYLGQRRCQAPVDPLRISFG